MNMQKAKSVSRWSTRGSAAASGWPRWRRSRISRGQSAVEFALISVLALAVMLLAIQFALIGQAAVAVSQGSSALARYVANNPGALGTNNGSLKASALPASVQNLLSSSILTNSANDLTMSPDARRRYVIEQCERYGWNTEEFLSQIDAAKVEAERAKSA